MAADWLAAGKTADGLIDHCLKNGSGKIFSGRAFIDQRLYVRFGEDAAAGSNRVNFLILSGVFVQSGGIRLDQGRHLIDKRTCAAGADAVHTLFYISVFKINNLCVFAAQFDCHIRLRRVVIQGGRDGNDFLNKRDVYMFCERKTSGACDNGADSQVAQAAAGICDQSGKRFLNVGKMTFIV